MATVASAAAAVTLTGAEQLLGKVGFGALMATTGLYWGKAAFKVGGKEHGQVETAAMAVSSAVVASMLTVRWVESGHFPLSNMYESLLFLGWGVTAVHLYLSRKVPDSAIAGVFTSPAALAIVAGATLLLPPELQRASALVPALKSNWLMMHVTVMMLSYASLMVGSLMCFGYLVLDQPADSLLGRARAAVPWAAGGPGAPAGAPGAAPAEAAGPAEAAEALEGAGGVALAAKVEVAEAAGAAEEAAAPAADALIETVDDLGYRSTGLGFAFLTAGLISGAVWANEAWGSYWSWDPKETWALITWLVYALYLHTRLSDDWTDRDTNKVGAAGFVVTWVCYAGVNLFGVGLHSYGFFK